MPEDRQEARRIIAELARAVDRRLAIEVRELPGGDRLQLILTHGSHHAQIEYKCTALYDPCDEVGIAHNDPVLAIPWPVQQPLLSERDKRNISFSAFIDLLSDFNTSVDVAEPAVGIRANL